MYYVCTFIAHAYTNVAASNYQLLPAHVNLAVLSKMDQKQYEVASNVFILTISYEFPN